MQGLKDTIVYILLFFTVQIGATALTQSIWTLVADGEPPFVLSSIVGMTVFAVGVMALFLSTGWAKLSNSYLRTRPWGTLTWCFLAVIGCLIPSMWVQEHLTFLPNIAEEQLGEIMKDRWGYLVVGILAPVAEEIVFRGAILRALLGWNKQANYAPVKGHWRMIAISALLFSLVHLNPAQMPHAFVVGLLLGWMYYRTGSIIPAMLFHWVNNSVAYILYNVLPNPDAPLVYHFGGSDRAVMFAVLCSLCILIPSLFQLHLRMKRAS